ncbi:hypothetical protein F5Y05DRAFT_105285 [Hypoxylon sp. FL0543]|nr:hypothetical protein F5Y05DRAFT_105285 [Hypoxylon sp. FL0543]
MAPETLPEQVVGSLSLVATMKASRQRPGPNGSRVVKKGSLPRLGDGLTWIVQSPTDSPAPGTESSTHTSSHGSPLETTVSTPGSDFTSPGTIQYPGARERIKTPCPHTSGCGLLPSDVKQHAPGPPTLADGLSLLSITEDNDFQKVYSRPGRLPAAAPTTPFPIHPSPFTPNVCAGARDSLGLSTGSHSVSPSARNEIVSWLLAGRLSLVEAKEMAEKHQYADLLGALKAPQATVIEEITHVIVNRQQKCDMSTVMVQPPILSPIYMSNYSSPGAHSQRPSSIDEVVEQFYSKLVVHSNTDKIITPGTETNLHVFVDMSNIFIGFLDAVKSARHIPRNYRIVAPPFSFKALSLVLERGRGVQKRVVAGSTHTCSAKDPRMYWPDYFLEAEKLGYQMNIFSRVQTRKPKRRGFTPPGNSPYEAPCLSPEDSAGDDDTGGAYEVRNGEQGVDENLHLNMMNSMFDHLSCPGTMVLATGDAAEAEFSDGFLKYATRALNSGWKLELVTWKRSVSSAWTHANFLEKYEGRFRIIFLDDFFEELQANFTSS